MEDKCLRIGSSKRQKNAQAMPVVAAMATACGRSAIREFLYMQEDSKEADTDNGNGLV